MNGEFNWTEIIMKLMVEFEPEVSKYNDCSTVVPIKDLGFDSQDDIDLICAVEERTGLDFDPKMTLLFHNEDGETHLRSINEVVDFLDEYCSKTQTQ